jgi:hypothetical protein
MTRAWLGWIAVGVSLVAGAARADRAAPPVMEEPPPQQPPRRILPPQAQPVSPVIAEQAKAVEGSWKCKGVQIGATGSSTPMAGTLTGKLELDGAWIHLQLVDTAPGSAKLDIYRTFDAVAKEWTELVMASDASHATATSLGEQGGTWVWNGALAASTGTVQVRDSETHGAQWKLWGEQLLGGDWHKTYEMTCSR